MNLIKNGVKDNYDIINETKNDLIKKEWSIITKLILIKLIAPPPTIYLIRNKITNGRYVGQTIRKVSDRWNQHCRETRQNTPLYRSIKKYGIENFEFSILEVSPSYTSLDELERKHIREQKSFIKLNCGGYNLTEGGNGLRCVSDLTRKKIGISGKGRISTRKGIPLSDSHKKLLSDLLSGVNNPNYGKHHSDEVKEKIAKTKRGKTLPAEHKLKIKESVINTYKSLSKESWNKIRSAGNANLDRHVYSFKNKFTGESFIGMRHELYTKYQLNKNLLRRMIKGELSHTKGWSLYKM